MHRIVENAALSRWRNRTVETTTFCLGAWMACLLAPGPFAGPLVGLASLCAAVVSGAPPMDLARGLLAGLGFALLSLAPLSLSATAEPGWGLRPDPEGFRLGILAGCRVFGALATTLLLVHSTPLSRLAGLARRLGIPRIVVDVFDQVHREIFVLDGIRARQWAVLASRHGCRTRAATRRSLSLGASALLVRAYERSRRRTRAMESRGFRDGFLPHPVPNHPIRIAAMALALAAPALLAYLAIRGARHVGF